MTSRERIKAAFLHTEPDRTPAFEYVLLSPVAHTVLGRKYEDYGGDMNAWVTYAEELGYEKALKQYAIDRIEIAQKLGHDLIYCVPNPPDSVLKKEPVIDNTPYDDPVEIIKKNNLLTKKKLEQPLHEFIVYSFLRKEMEIHNMDLPIYAPAFTHGIWTNTDLMETMYLEPETAHEHFSLCTETSLRMIEAYMDLGIEIIGVGGDFAGNRPLISPDMYRNFIMPELRKITDLIRSRGKFSVNASDGDLWNVIDDFLIGSGVDGYGEIDAGAGMDMGKLKKRFGNRITLLGNIDCGRLLSFGSEEEICKSVRRCLEDGLGSGGHIFTASNAIAGSVGIKNYLCMVNEYREFFGLAKISVESR